MDKNLKTQVHIDFTNNNKQKTKRNFAIDLARIISMYFLINHHLIFHGGPIYATKLLSFENNLQYYAQVLIYLA